MVSRLRYWIKQAKRNLASAYANLREGLYEEVCFEAHQVGEKALRGLMDSLYREKRSLNPLYTF